MRLKSEFTPLLTLKSALLALMITAWIGLMCVCVLSVRAAERLKPAPFLQRLREQLIITTYRGILALTHVRVHVQGELDAARPLILMANHISYLDILVLGSQLPVRFTPKSDIAKWPIIGSICKLCGDVFVDRRPEKIREAKSSIHAALQKGQVICLFPEATTGNGMRLLNFKSGIFSLAFDEVHESRIHIQPVAIAYTHLWRLPIDSTQWPRLAWYGDMDLLPHLWSFLKLGRLDVQLKLLPSFAADAVQTRRELSANCQNAIQAALRGGL